MQKKTLIIMWILASSLLLAGCSSKAATKTEDVKATQEDSHMSQLMSSQNISEEMFLRNMIPHHQEAIYTAGIVVKNSTNPEMIKLTQNIIDAQTKEVAMMQGRLDERYSWGTAPIVYEKMMPALENFTGDQLDTAFLHGMIMHHMGAIHMAQGVLQVSPRTEVDALAQNIIINQSAEIKLMQQIWWDIRNKQ